MRLGLAVLLAQGHRAEADFRDGERGPRKRLSFIVSFRERLKGGSVIGGLGGDDPQALVIGPQRFAQHRHALPEPRRRDRRDPAVDRERRGAPNRSASAPAARLPSGAMPRKASMKNPAAAPQMIGDDGLQDRVDGRRREDDAAAHPNISASASGKMRR